MILGEYDLKLVGPMIEFVEGLFGFKFWTTLRLHVRAMFKLILRLTDYLVMHTSEKTLSRYYFLQDLKNVA